MTTTKRKSKSTIQKRKDSKKKTTSSIRLSKTKILSTNKRAVSILHTRAKELAEEQHEGEISQDQIEIVEFILAYEKYGIESSYISEVHPMKEFTNIPGAPPFVLGIINLRGQILSVIDIRRFFELPVKGISNLNRVIVVKNNLMEIGILADFILSVRNITVNKIHTTLPTLTGIRAEYLKGVTSERLVILDMAKILSDERIVVHQEVD